MSEYDPMPFALAGSILLDAREPKWAKAPKWHLEVKLNELDMSDPCDDILAHLYSDYLIGLKELGILPGSDQPILLGFDVPAEPAETKPERYAALTAAWTQIVTERLAASRQASTTPQETRVII